MRSSPAPLATPARPFAYFRDRSGRILPLRVIALGATLLPALWLAVRAATTGLGSKPLTAAIHFTGDWAVYLLLATLAVTPLRHLLNQPRLIQTRRILGLSVLGYALLHILFYSFEQGGDLARVLSEILKRTYLQIGAVAVIMLVALGLTSRDVMIQRLGTIAWQKLHLLVHPVAVLALVHFFLQSKIDVSRAVLVTGVYLWLVLFRIMHRRHLAQGVWGLMLLAVGAALLTACAEALWYGLATGIGWQRPLLSNLDFQYELSAAWNILIAGLGMTALGTFFGRQPAARLRGSGS
jgi:methionine sulfoxide reductase heme-binding subunit